MFTRRLVMNLRPDSASKLARVTENEIVPLLRRQKGFRNVVTSIDSGRSRAVSYTCWETKEDAEAYHRTGHQESLKFLVDVVVGLPRVETFELSDSAFHEIAAKAA
jgi:heme-degrading monooxygenase HmoA